MSTRSDPFLTRPTSSPRPFGPETTSFSLDSRLTPTARVRPGSPNRLGRYEEIITVHDPIDKG